MLRSERSAMAPWHQRTSSSPHQAVVYMLHSAVLKGNLWNLRRLSASVPRTRLFVLYDGKAVPERVHGLIEAHAQVVACPWRDSLATMSSHILNLSQEKPELGLNGHSFIEPVLACWCERFCSLFSRAWFIEKDAGFNGAVHQFFSSFDADDSDLLTHRFNLVQPEVAWLGLGLGTSATSRGRSAAPNCSGTARRFSATLLTQNRGLRITRACCGAK